SAYFKEDVSEEEILSIRQEMLAVPEVQEVEYVSREEALDRFRESRKNDRIVMESLDAVGQNPLLASLNIKAWKTDQYESISLFLEASAFAGLIQAIDYHDRAPVIQRLAVLVGSIQVSVLLAIIALAAIAVLVVFNTIRLTIYHAKEEIEIMRLVGASNWFIRGPFIIQGAIVGGVAVFFSSLLLFLVLLSIRPWIEGFIVGFSLFPFVASYLPALLFWQLTVGIGVGVFSSLFAIRKHLKV
ncbi:MAG: permease-like cell division protein FtsX, partial [bacterium]|nr:permease-like cell division protein FtsX [bacterium]